MKLHLVIDGDVAGSGSALASALTHLADQVRSYTHAELEGATFELKDAFGEVRGTVELRETGDDE